MIDFSNESLYVFETIQDYNEFIKLNNSVKTINYIIYEEDNPFIIRNKKTGYDLDLTSYYNRNIIDITFLRHNDPVNYLDNFNYFSSTKDCSVFIDKIKKAKNIVNKCSNNLIGKVIFESLISKNKYVLNYIKENKKIIDDNNDIYLPTLIFELEIIRLETVIDDFNKFYLSDEIIEEYLLKYPFFKEKDFILSDFNLFNRKLRNVSFNERLYKIICY